MPSTMLKRFGTKFTFSCKSFITDIACIDQVTDGEKGNLAVVHWRRCAARYTVTNETYGRPLSVPHTLGGRIFFTLLERWLHTFVFGLEEVIEYLVGSLKYSMIEDRGPQLQSTSLKTEESHLHSSVRW